MLVNISISCFFFFLKNGHADFTVHLEIQDIQIVNEHSFEKEYSWRTHTSNIKTHSKATESRLGHSHSVAWRPRNQYALYA